MLRSVVVVSLCVGGYLAFVCLFDVGATWVPCDVVDGSVPYICGVVVLLLVCVFV